MGRFFKRMLVFILMAFLCVCYFSNTDSITEYAAHKGRDEPKAQEQTLEASGRYLSVEEEILRLVNEERKAKGLKELKKDDQAALVARKKVKEMMDYEYFDHVSPQSGDITAQFEKFGGIILGVDASVIGENIAKMEGYQEEQITARFLVEEWMNSPSHRENILNSSYCSMGCAVYYSSRQAYAAQEFLLTMHQD